MGSHFSRIFKGLFRPYVERVKLKKLSLGSLGLEGPKVGFTLSLFEVPVSKPQNQP